MMLSHLLLELSGVLLRCEAARHLERHLRGFKAHFGLEDPTRTQHGQATGLPALSSCSIIFCPVWLMLLYSREPSVALVFLTGEIDFWSVEVTREKTAMYLFLSLEENHSWTAMMLGDFTPLLMPGLSLSLPPPPLQLTFHRRDALLLPLPFLSWFLSRGSQDAGIMDIQAPAPAVSLFVALGPSARMGCLV